MRLVLIIENQSPAFANMQKLTLLGLAKWPPGNLLVNHKEAADSCPWCSGFAFYNCQLFVTTDYIIDETATLLNARGIGHLAGVLFDTVHSSHACRMEWMDNERFAKTQTCFEKHIDHAWSFTDCFSFLIMKELKLRYALTKDRRFKEAGYTPLLIEKLSQDSDLNPGYRFSSAFYRQ